MNWIWLNFFQRSDKLTHLHAKWIKFLNELELWLIKACLIFFSHKLIVHFFVICLGWKYSPYVCCCRESSTHVPWITSIQTEYFPYKWERRHCLQLSCAKQCQLSSICYRKSCCFVTHLLKPDFLNKLSIYFSVCNTLTRL